ncbi:MAG: transglutaminase-like domain-containing protein [Nitrospiraceae bacterium]|nr:transglutaminase-like domain-containing protein [Nitrospiraceae bacterium]
MRSLLFIFAVSLILLPQQSYTKTLILDGELESRIKTTQQISFDVSSEVKSLTFRFALPAVFSNKATSQSLERLDLKFSIEPSSVIDDVDRFGNRFKKVRWDNLRQNVNITISFDSRIKSELKYMESKSQFPLANISGSESLFLKSTGLVQSEDPEIAELSRRLTANARTEQDAVNAILNWVSDNVKYTYNPPQYDAVYTYRSGKGNCQNFAHLSMALLRAAGIPSRIVGGISLKRQWKVPVENGYLVQDMGQGGHAWMEIYFPDLGWLSYDPQQSRQFTSTRHIKQTHGLDSKDINDSWSAAPYLPKYSESIEAVFNTDDISIKLAGAKEAPKSYIMSNNLSAKVSAEKPELPIKPPFPPIIIKPEPPVKPPPVKKGDVAFGNTDFPALVDAYQAIGNEGTRILDKETAEYVTSKYIYAQAFTVANTMSLKNIALALRKFGGDGSIYIDVVKDDNGKPGFTGERSLPIFLNNIKFRPGYYWVDFAFTKGKEPYPILKQGKYWIILRHSGEAIVNWFYIPGNPYGDSDDTRSTVKGYKWEDLLNYDFVFKVTGRI